MLPALLPALLPYQYQYIYYYSGAPCPCALPVQGYEPVPRQFIRMLARRHAGPYMLRGARQAWPSLQRHANVPVSGHRAAGVRHLSVETLQHTIAPLSQTLDYLHAASGLSWPVFIPAATFMVRMALTAPLAVWNRLRTRRQRSLQAVLGASVPVIKAQLAQQVARQQSSLTAEQIVVLAAKERRKRRIQLYREFQCQNWKTLLLPLVQIPTFCAMSLAVRSLVGFDLSAVTEFGNTDASQFLWFRNLVEPDPYGVVPLLIGGFSLANVEMNARAASSAGASGAAQQRRGGPSVAAALANISRAGSVLFMAVSFQAPMALELYWLSSNAFSFVQNVLLDRYVPAVAPTAYPGLDVRVMRTRDPIRAASDARARQNIGKMPRSEI